MRAKWNLLQANNNAKEFTFKDPVLEELMKETAQEKGEWSQKDGLRNKKKWWEVKW